MISWTEILEYDGGVLRWKPRHRDLFKNERLYRSWTNRFSGKEAGYIEPPKRGIESYVRIRYNGKQYYAHRIVWEMFNGSLPKSTIIDHINGDGLDNRIQNLRAVNPLGSCTNRPMSRSNKSGVVGVCLNKKHKRWQATIGKTYLGSFKHFEDAVNARKDAEKGSGYHPNHGRIGRMRGHTGTESNSLSPSGYVTSSVQDAATGQ